MLYASGKRTVAREERESPFPKGWMKRGKERVSRVARMVPAVHAECRWRARVRGTRYLSCVTTNPFSPLAPLMHSLFSRRHGRRRGRRRRQRRRLRRENRRWPAGFLSLSLSLFAFFPLSAPTRLRTPLLNYFKPLSRCNVTTRERGGRLVENKTRSHRCRRVRLSRGAAVESTARAYIPLEGSSRPWQESAADVLTFREKTSALNYSPPGGGGGSGEQKAAA